MKGTFKRGHQKQQRTHVMKPSGLPFKVPEYGPFATIEEAEAAGKVAMECAAKLGLKCTVTTIEVHDSTAQRD